MAILIPDYRHLWETMKINPGAIPEAKRIAGLIKQGFNRYENVSYSAALAIPNGTPCPWYFIGLTHLMECSLSWNKHLHNGDPLTARTVNVPAGRPRKGTPPFTWEESAIDAIRLQDLNNAKLEWDLFLVLQKLEEYNGLGYQKRGIYTPYLWSMTNHYIKGKYVADGKYDPEAVSTQVGCAAVLKFLI